MLISHSHRFIFFHVAKTGGLSVREALLPYAEEPARFKIPRPAREDREGKPNPLYTVWETLLLHAKASDARRELGEELFRSYFKFAFVRNPWDWHVSMYHFILREPTHIRHRLVSDMGSFEQFLHWVVKTPNPYPKGATRTQLDALCAPDRSLLVDAVGRYEHLSTDFQRFCNQLNVQADLGHLNRSHHASYTQYYTQETRALIAEHFKEDIQTFGYTFGAP